MNKRVSIENIIRKCKSSDRKAQKDLYLMFADTLMSISLRYSKDTHEAKDLIHDTFLKVFSKIDTYDKAKGKFKPWIIRILINEALQRFRKNKKVYFTDDILTLDQEDYNINGLDRLIAEDILFLIKQLPEGSRMVFNLYVIEGYKHKDIAEKLGINSSTSRAHLTRAKKLLRISLAKLKNGTMTLKNEGYGN